MEVQGDRVSRCVAWMLCAVLLLSVCGPARGEGRWRFAADPDGVVEVGQAPDLDGAQSADGTAYLLAADQVLLTGNAPVWHREVSYAITGDRGLHEGGRIQFSFQPAYQRLEIHALDVWRDGRRLDHRDLARIDVLRRERDLESGLMDGSLTVNITLPGLRVGDVVSYRSSVVGFNPVFGKDYHDSYGAWYSVPLKRRLIRFVHPASQPLYWKAPERGYRVSRYQQAGNEVLELRALDMAPLREEDDTPGSFSPFGRIEVSTLQGWPQVAAWAAPLYPRGFVHRSGLAVLVDELELRADDPVGSALRATAFVQGEIRYTGVDMGENSHAPNRPELVLERRYGDCKDKSVLLIALLAEAGIQADPVLVHTSQRGGIQTRLPSPFAFNHVVVRARIDGREIWIDPTWAREHGDFDSRAPLPYRYGLPAATGTSGLVVLPDPVPTHPLVEVEQQVLIEDDAALVRARFDVRTHYRQGFAGDVRAQFAAEDAAHIGKGYLQYMQGYYEGMTSLDVPAVADHGDALDVSEEYELQWDPGVAGREFVIVLFQVQDWLPKIADAERIWPLALGGPRHGRQTVRTALAGGWNMEDEEDLVETPYFRFRRVISVEGDTLVIQADWERLVDEVPASEVRALRARVAEVKELLYFGVQFGDGSVSSAWHQMRLRDWIWPLAVFVATICGLVVLWWLRARWVFAGMFYRPGVSMREVMASGRLHSLGLTLVALAALIDTVFEFGQRTKPEYGAPMLIGVGVGLLFGMAIRWLIWSGLVGLSFRVLGHRLRFADVLSASGLGAAPMVLFYTAALVVLRFDTAMFGDAHVVQVEEWGSFLFAMLLVFSGLFWTLVSMTNACAALAGVRRRTAVSALCLTVLFTLLLLVPVAVIVMLRAL